MVLWAVIALIVAAALGYFTFSAALSIVWFIGWIFLALVVWGLLAEVLEGVWAGGLIALIIVLVLLFEFVF